MLNITIHNQYPGLKLTSPVYFSTGTTCRVFSNQKTDIGTIARASFGIGSRQKEFKGALLYRLQRKYANRTNNRSNGRTKPIEKTRNTHFLVAWDIFNTEDQYHGFYVFPIECPDDFTWDGDKLWKLRYQYMDQISENYEYTSIPWLINDSTMIRTRYDISYGSDYKLDVFIYEETGKYSMDGPMKFAPERLVLP
jgi:hypothetical protein